MRPEGKRWHRGVGDYVEAPEVEAFLAEIAEVCKRHGLDIEHEDSQGGFLIERLSEGGEPNSIMHAALGRTMRPR